MERKLVKQGRNALTMTLPSQWVKSKGLTQNDAVHVEMKNNALIVRTDSKTGWSSIEIDARPMEKSQVWHKVIGAYIDGYDEIILLHDDFEDAQRLTLHLTGMVVAEHSSKRTRLKSIVTVPEESIKPLFRRVLHMFAQLGEILVQIAEGKKNMREFKDYEWLLDEMVYYSLRYLNKYAQFEHAYRYFLLLSTIEAAGDQLSLIANHIKRKVKLAQFIRRKVTNYSTYVAAEDFQKLYRSLRHFRRSLGTSTFVDGCTYSLAEMLYNNIGFLLQKEMDHKLL